MVVTWRVVTGPPQWMYIPPGTPLPCGVINWAAGPPTPLTGPASPTNITLLVNSSMIYARYRLLITVFFSAFDWDQKTKIHKVWKTNENIALRSHRILRDISRMRCSVSSPDETPRRELKIRHAAEYFWRTSWCFIWWWNSVKCLILLLKWDNFTRKKLRMQKWAFFHLIFKLSLNINISFVVSLWIINEFEKDTYGTVYGGGQVRACPCLTNNCKILRLCGAISLLYLDVSPSELISYLIFRPSFQQCQWYSLTALYQRSIHKSYNG